MLRFITFQRISIFLLLVTCTLVDPDVSYQDTVDALINLTQNLDEIPDSFAGNDITKVVNSFVANAYFSVLDHLSMEPGYTLDYVYVSAIFWEANPSFMPDH